MDLLHATWFWVAIIVAPIFTVLATLARLARREPPPKLSPGVSPLRWQDETEGDDDEPPARASDSDKGKQG